MIRKICFLQYNPLQYRLDSSVGTFLQKYDPFGCACITSFPLSFSKSYWFFLLSICHDDYSICHDKMAFLAELLLHHHHYRKHRPTNLLHQNTLSLNFRNPILSIDLLQICLQFHLLFPNLINHLLQFLQLLVQRHF